ncbi:MAG: hypothetical protein KKD28_10810 [Chloroflexi bacterium]|nr:hypothetical protein [Chloroflexota bacterium]
MRRGRIFIYLALIIILGLAAVFVLYQRNAQTPSDADQASEPVPVIELVDVVVVTQAIPRGALLDDAVVTTIQIPKTESVAGMFFDDMGLVVGRRAKFDLDSGILLTASMLVESAEQLSTAGSVAALLIPSGKVAVSIPITRLSSVSYAPRPGDHVSVIVTVMFVDVDSEFQTTLPNQVGGVSAPGGGGEEGGPVFITAQVMGASGNLGRTELDPLLNELMYIVPSESQRARLVSQTLLPDVVVLQVGDFPLEDSEKAPEDVVASEESALVEPAPVTGEAPVSEKIKPPDVITLIVSPQEAVTLNYLLYSGAELTLALRGIGDDTIATTEAATLQFLLDEYNISVPAKLPYGLNPRIDNLAPPELINDGQPTEGTQ